MKLSSGPNALLAAAGLVIVVAALKIGAPILVPLALSIFLATITMPLVAWLRRKGVPTPVAVPLVILMTFGALAGLVSVATQSVNQMRLAFPRYVARFEAMEASLGAALRQRGIEIPAGLHAHWTDPDWIMNIASNALVGVAGFMSTTLLVFIITIFVLIEANGFPVKIRAALGTPTMDLSRFTKIATEVQRYLAIKTVISLVTGALAGLWVWILGVDFPIFWGLVAFLFNYVPNIGSFVAAIPPAALGLIQLGPNGAVLTAVGYLVINVVLGNVVEPSLLGRKLGLSTLVVMLSLVFWGWIWGPIGLLLALPLTMSVRIMLENTESYRWIAVLLGPATARAQASDAGTGAQPETSHAEQRHAGSPAA